MGNELRIPEGPGKKQLEILLLCTIDDRNQVSAMSLELLRRCCYIPPEHCNSKQQLIEFLLGGFPGGVPERARDEMRNIAMWLFELIKPISEDRLWALFEANNKCKMQELKVQAALVKWYTTVNETIPFNFPLHHAIHEDELHEDTKNTIMTFSDAVAKYHDSGHHRVLDLQKQCFDEAELLKKMRTKLEQLKDLGDEAAHKIKMAYTSTRKDLEDYWNESAWPDAAAALNKRHKR